MKRSRQSGFKYGKIIYCIMDVIIMLLIAGFIFKLSQTNSQIQDIDRLPSHLFPCLLCGETQIEYGEDSCCQGISNGQCITIKKKNNCKEDLLDIKKKLTQFYTKNLYILILLACIFLLLQCCCDPCVTFIAKKIRKRYREKDDSRLLKSGFISTLQLQASSSSYSSFSSMNDNIASLNRQQSFFYRMDQMACPVCLQTMEHQKVICLCCKHIMHSSCARKKGVCPICV